jgi:hypothetical protein
MMKKKICAKKRNPARLDIIKLRGISALVTSGGFEPPTSRLGGERSIQLSYEAMHSH